MHTCTALVRCKRKCVANSQSPGDPQWGCLAYGSVLARIVVTARSSMVYIETSYLSDAASSVVLGGRSVDAGDACNRIA